ncbi:D-glycero-alpha-D-manno-heptose-1,7-bisphosphate 7-phosphatase [Desulfocurvus sp. DL9XJH121]
MLKPLQNVILDRDGTVIRDRHYLSDPDGVELLPGAARGLARLAGAGVRLFLASNQSGIGRGYFGLDEHQAVQARLDEVLAGAGVRLAGAAFCPHAPEDGCACRKPATGMWEDLAREHGLDAQATAMVGDKPADVSMGLNAGLAATVLVLTGKGRESAEKLGLPPLTGPCMELPERREGWPHAVAEDLDAASRWLLEQGGRA